MGCCPSEDKVRHESIENVSDKGQVDVHTEIDPMKKKKAEVDVHMEIDPMEKKKLFESSLNSFKKIKQIQSSICRINGIAKKKEDDNTGTGYLMEYSGEKFILTNYHVLEHKEFRYVAIFQNLDESKQDQFDYKEIKTFGLDKDLDIGLARCVADHPKNRFHFDLKADMCPSKNDAVMIFQHPGGGPLQQSFGVVTAISEKEIHYRASTAGGSSGSLVLGANCKPIALHKASHKKGESNVGTKFKSVCKWINENRGNLFPKMAGRDTDSGGDLIIPTIPESKCDGIYKPLSDILQWQRSICQIGTKDFSSISQSGFLAQYHGHKFIITTDSIKDVQEYVAWFDTENEQFSVNLKKNPQHLPDLNLYILEYEADDRLKNLVFFNIEISEEGKEDDAVVVFQRPVTEPLAKQVSPIHQSVGSIKKIVQRHIFYNAAVGKCSEGSLVLSADWEPLAVHFNFENEASSLSRGVKISAITEWLTNPFSAGESIMAKWSDNFWYNAKIQDKTEKGYLVHYDDFDENYDQDITTLRHLIPFENLANECYDSQKFAEATFWFFQHKMYNKLNGANSPKLQSAMQKCGSEWEGILQFLEEQKKSNMINYFTSWNEAQKLWKNNRTETKESQAIVAKKKKQTQEFKVTINNTPMPQEWKPLANDHDLTERFTNHDGKCSVSQTIDAIKSGQKTPNTFYVKSSSRKVYYKIETTNKLIE